MVIAIVFEKFGFLLYISLIIRFSFFNACKFRLRPSDLIDFIAEFLKILLTLRLLYQ
jgi:hypothetical protein